MYNFLKFGFVSNSRKNIFIALILMWFKYTDDVYCSKEKLTSNRLWNPIMLLFSVGLGIGIMCKRCQTHSGSNGTNHCPNLAIISS